MNIFARFHRNKVDSFENSRKITEHRKLCNCRICKKKRKKDLKVSCAFLMPLVGIMAIIASIF